MRLTPRAHARERQAADVSAATADAGVGRATVRRSRTNRPGEQTQVRALRLGRLRGFVARRAPPPAVGPQWRHGATSIGVVWAVCIRPRTNPSSRYSASWDRHIRASALHERHTFGYILEYMLTAGCQAPSRCPARRRSWPRRRIELMARGVTLLSRSCSHGVPNKEKFCGSPTRRMQLR